MKKIYYTCYPETGDFDELTGWKTIYVYKIEKEELILIAQFEVSLSSSTVEEIKERLELDFEYELKFI